MISTRAGVELAIVIISLGTFVGYHVWILLLRGRGYRLNKDYHDFIAAGKLARSVWARASAADDKEAILAVQTARNAITACTWIAGAAAVLATAGLTIILDSSKTDRIEQLAISDPMSRNLDGMPLASPVVVLALALGCLYCSFVCCAQSVRLYVHLGFYIRAVSSQFNPGMLTAHDAATLAIRAGWAFTIGLRLFYLFVPLAMWCVGITALLVTSLVMTAVLYVMDRFEPGPSAIISLATVPTGTRIPEVTSSPEEEDAGAPHGRAKAAASNSEEEIQSRRRFQQAVQLSDMV